MSALHYVQQGHRTLFFLRSHLDIYSIFCWPYKIINLKINLLYLFGHKVVLPVCNVHIPSLSEIDCQVTQYRQTGLGQLTRNSVCTVMYWHVFCISCNGCSLLTLKIYFIILIYLIYIYVGTKKKS